MRIIFSRAELEPLIWISMFSLAAHNCFRKRALNRFRKSDAAAITESGTSDVADYRHCVRRRASA